MVDGRDISGDETEQHGEERTQKAHNKISSALLQCYQYKDEALEAQDRCARLEKELQKRNSAKKTS